MTWSLASGEVHSWYLRLDLPPEACAHLAATLSPEERERSGALRFAHDRRRFIVAHGRLRELLGRYLQTAPQRIRYVRGRHGKPALAPEFGGRVRFNLAHSVDRALVAVAADTSVGVDLERVGTQPEDIDVARCFLSAAEVEALQALPPPSRAEAFIESWTLNEAWLKARGLGLAAANAVQPAVDARHWTFYRLRPAPRFIGALVVEKKRATALRSP